MAINKNNELVSYFGPDKSKKLAILDLASHLVSLFNRIGKPVLGTKSPKAVQIGLFVPAYSVHKVHTPLRVWTFWTGFGLDLDLDSCKQNRQLGLIWSKSKWA